jgi:hypothetical protein
MVDAPGEVLLHQVNQSSNKKLEYIRKGALLHYTLQVVRLFVVYLS